ncbi:auxin-responsive protein IAA13 isoform X1 [Lactuca sativa]|uniref:auxin-responsive protein IAA13 isoform X1 n=1 Tax=Lactuca sativa TaxID=4236 RepID=UPI000CD7F54F|nr:auxin-responsive protein IAA13 isoform X1 [Lactuca sativa]
MDVTLGLLGNSPAVDDGGGGGVPSGGSTTARSILTVSKEDNKNNMVTMSVEVTSSYPVVDENLDDLELGLGLSIGIGGGLKSKAVVAGPCWNQYARILTAKDFPSLVSKPNSSSSSSSVNIPNSSTSGSKRTAADSVSPPNGNSVVGWPPVSRAHRIPSLANNSKSQTEELNSIPEQNKNKNTTNRIKDYSTARNEISYKKYRSVKVNMDGTLIGRKVDLNAHTSYEALAQTLEEMFWGRRKLVFLFLILMKFLNCIFWCLYFSITDVGGGSSRLLDGTSEFVLTYEDKDGDCMLVGDVPWQMFLSSVKRLRIMKNSDSSELSRNQHETHN